MDAPTLRRYREHLLRLKAEIANEGDVKIEPTRQDPADTKTDDDAQPLTEMSQTIASSRNRTRADVLERVVAAMARIDDEPDSFGICTECDEPIARKRLDVMPYVELCVDCQQALDADAGRRVQGGRRHLRDFR